MALCIHLDIAEGESQKRKVQFSLEPSHRNNDFHFVSTFLNIESKCTATKPFCTVSIYRMDGVIVSLAVLLLSVMAILLGSSAQHQNFLPENRTGLIQQSSVQYMDYSRSWPQSPLTYQITDRKSYKSKGKGPNRLAKLTRKMRRWLKKREKKLEQEIFDLDNMVIAMDNPTPVFEQKFSANGSIPEDGCDSSSVKFDDGNCYPLMGRKPCSDPRQWVTVNPKTFKGQCTPRLCGRDRVFVVRTGLCHDIYDTSECQGGRRLYYSSYGDPVCDCPIGQYPFPYPRDDCVPIFTQGPCPYGQVVTINAWSDLSCTPSQCLIADGKSAYDQIEHFSPKQKQLVPTKNGKCYELGSIGPCSSYDGKSQLLGYDIFKRQLECVDITNSSLPYFSSDEENELLNSVYDQFYPEYDFFRIWLIYQTLHLEEAVKHGKKKKKKIRNSVHQRKQGNTLGVFQVPGGKIPLLNPSRPGRGLDKGTNPVVPERNRRDVKQAVKPGVSTNCGGNQIFIAATGQCRNRNF